MFSQKTRISSGVPQLDQLLGGLYIGDNVIWYDDAGSLAELFCLNFVQESLDHNKPLIYVSFDRSPKTLLEELGPMAESQHLTILDCFTHGKGDGSDIFSKFYEKDGAQWPYQIVRVQEPWKPTLVAESIYKLHQTMKGDVRFVFESLTGMQNLWDGETDIIKFYSRSCPKLYELDTIAYWVIEKGAHSEQLRARINQIAQVAIELSLKRGRSTLTILKADKRKPDTLNNATSFWNEGLSVTFETDSRRSGKIDLGTRLKELRTKQGLSQKKLADMVGVTPSSISQIESNSIYPSLPALFKIAETLCVEIGSLFQDKLETGRRTVFTGGGRMIPFPDLPKGVISGKSLLPSDYEAGAEPFVIEIPPRESLDTHFFVHKGEELGYVLSGKLHTVINNLDYQVISGDLIYLTRDAPTEWKNKGNEPARLLWVKLR